MRRELGDILPQVSDDCRFDLIQHKIPFYRRIVENCDTCGGNEIYTKKGVKYKCPCSKSLKIIIEMLKSNFPQQHLNIFNDEFFERKVVELPIDVEGKAGKPFNFSTFCFNFLDNKEYIVENSCSSLFCGNNESGKTYAALYMLADFIKNGFSGHYIRFKNYLNLLNSSYNNMDDRKVLRQLREVKLLIIDELGKEHGKSEYATCELEELIKTRQDNMSSTIIITNLDYKDFVEVYGNHVKSAFNKNFKILLFHPDASLREKTRVVWPS
jgi:DNA replication protein DnaC